MHARRASRLSPPAQAYLQYLPQLQLDGDFFVFELEPMLAQPGRWDRISEIVPSTDIQPSPKPSPKPKPKPKPSPSPKHKP